MNIPDELSQMRWLISIFADQEEAINLLLNSPYVIPLYNSGRFKDLTGYLYYDIEERIHEQFSKQENLPTSILIEHLWRAKENFRLCFRFPGETRRHEREERIDFESRSKIRFIDWYKESKGCYPEDDYSDPNFQIDLEDFKGYLRNRFPDIDFEFSDENYDDDGYSIDISQIRDTSPNRAYNETGVPFSDDAGSEWWESRY